MSTQINTHGLLTPREEDVFLLIAEGKLIKDAARCLRISRKVTYEHVDHAKFKLDAETTPHAVSLLWAQGHIKVMAVLFLALAVWLPVAETLRDDTTAIARTNSARRTGRSRRNNRGQRDGNTLFYVDPDSGDFSAPTDALTPTQIEQLEQIA